MTEGEDACTPAPAGAVFFCIKGQGTTSRPGRGKSLGRGVLAVALRHNLRHNLPSHPTPPGVDATLTHRNEVVMGGSTPDEVMRLLDEALTARGVAKPTRKDAWHAIEVVFGTPPGMRDPDGYLRACADWLGRATGAPVVSAVIHRDQSTPHLHAIVVPVTGAERERNVGKEKRPSDGNAWKGSDLFCADAMARLNKDHASAVAAKFGLKRQSRPTRLQHEAVVHAVLQWMAQSPARECVTWPATEAEIRLDPFPRAKLIGLDAAAIMARIGLAERMTRRAGDDSSDRRSERLAPAGSAKTGRGQRADGAAGGGGNSLGATPSQDRSSAAPESQAAPETNSLGVEAEQACNSLGVEAAPMAPPPLPPLSPPPRPVLTLVHTTPRPAPIPAPQAPTPPPALAAKPPRCPQMTPALRAEIDSQERPANPSPDYLAYMRFHEWRTEQRRLQKLAKRERQAAKVASH